MPNRKETVYVIDPDESIRESLGVLLGTWDVAIQSYPDAETFLDSFVAADPGCIIVEADLPGMGSSDLLKHLQQARIDLPVVVLVSTTNRDIANQALQAGAVDVIDKPLVDGQLLDLVCHLLKEVPRLAASVPSRFTARNGKQITIRPIQPNDSQIKQAFIKELSRRSTNMRFFSGIKQLSPGMLERFTHPHYAHDWALIATVSEGGREKEVAVARYAPTQDTSCAEFAIVVADDWHGLGIASRLLRELVAVTEQLGIKTLEGSVLRENRTMLSLAKRLCFTIEQNIDDTTTVRVVRCTANAG